jgi:hypothetical protein
VSSTVCSLKAERLMSLSTSACGDLSKDSYKVIMAKKLTITMHTWAISRIKGTPAVEIGWVDAPDTATAIKEAIKRYGITDREQQKRLAARQVK